MTLSCLVCEFVFCRPFFFLCMSFFSGASSFFGSLCLAFLEARVPHSFWSFCCPCSRSSFYVSAFSGSLFSAFYSKLLFLKPFGGCPLFFCLCNARVSSLFFVLIALLPQIFFDLLSSDSFWLEEWGKLSILLRNGHCSIQTQQETSNANWFLHLQVQLCDLQDP